MKCPRTLAWLLIGVAVTIVHGSADDQAAGIDTQVSQIRKNIHLFNCSNGRRWVNVAAFTGRDGILLVDAGHRVTSQALLDEIRKVGSGEIMYVINDAVAMAHENTVERLKGSNGKKGGAAPGFPNKTVKDSMTFSFNGDTVRLIHLPHGHTDGDLIVHFVKAGVVCMGDLLFADALPFIFKHNGGSVDGFIANLGRVHDMFTDDITIIPGHGRVYTRSDLLKYREMLSGVTERIRGEIRSGKTSEEIFAADVLAPWKDWVSQEYVCDTAFIMVVQGDTQ
jgi:glyoxylase-like metal-dependent hydrolase (beta-lactamase superfamily II)